MVTDEARNDLIFDDVLRALEAGRSPVVITERTAHLEIIAKTYRAFRKAFVVLRGGKARSSAATLQRDSAIPQAENASLSRPDVTSARVR